MSCDVETRWLNLPLALRQAVEESDEAQDTSDLWQPHPDRNGEPSPQRLALESPAFICGYGGQAGGGKTDLQIGAAATQHQQSIIFRREYQQLKAIIERSRELFATCGRYNINEKMWRLDGGRRIEFGACQYEQDKYNYRGRPHDFIGIDEAAEFPESIIRFLIGWCRTTVEDQRCRVILAFNPPTEPEGEWIVRFFAPWLDSTHPSPAKPGELRWFARLDDEDKEVEGPEPFEHKGEEITPTSRTFFPARLADNPPLAKSGYGTVLQSLPEPLRSQLLYGDFSIGLERDPWQVIPTEWIKAAQTRWQALMADPMFRPGPIDVIGFDVAHGGKDKTVVAPRHGSFFADLHSLKGVDTPDGKSAAVFAHQFAEDQSTPYNTDAIGYGASACERLSDPHPEGFGQTAVQAINVAAGSTFRDKSGKYKMVNLRAEAFWRLREALDPDGGDNLALPPDPELLADLAAQRYRVRPSGIQLVDKEELKAKLGRSPDKGDAVALAMLPAIVSQGPPIVGMRRESAGWQPR